MCIGYDVMKWSDNYNNEFECCLYNGDFIPEEWLDIRRDGLITEEQFEEVKAYYKGHYLFS